MRNRGKHLAGRALRVMAIIESGATRAEIFSAMRDEYGEFDNARGVAANRLQNDLRYLRAQGFDFRLDARAHKYRRIPPSTVTIDTSNPAITDMERIVIMEVANRIKAHANTSPAPAV